MVRIAFKVVGFKMMLGEKMNQEEVLRAKKNLSDHELNVFNTEMIKHQKSTALAYLLWFFMGSLGIHKFYLGKVGLGLLYLLLGVAGWISLISSFSLALTDNLNGVYGGVTLYIVCFVILGILLFMDLFTIPRQIRERYNQAEIDVLSSMGS